MSAPRRPAAMRIAAWSLAVSLTAGMLTGCALFPTDAMLPAGPLVTIERRGGLCDDGVCVRTIAIEDDGRVHELAPKPIELGVLPPGVRASLLDALGSADFNRLRSRAFTAECPMAFDGIETIYTFSTASGPVRLGSCDIVIDPTDPLFAAVESALGSIATGGQVRVG